jgi:hypothetical protein
MERTVSPQRQLVKDKARHQWTVADRQHAYEAWRSLGTLIQASEATGIPFQTSAVWSSREHWSQRKEHDDAREQALAVARARKTIGRRVDRYLANVDQMAEGAENESVRLKANTFLLGVIGLSEVKQQVTTVREETLPPGTIAPLSEDDAAAIEAIFDEKAPVTPS